MKCVCNRKCVAIVASGKHVRFNPGQVHDFDECPLHFDPIEGEGAVEVDFSTASEEMLSETDFDLEELKKFIRDTYDIKAGKRGKEKTIELLADCRYRAQSSDPDVGGML